MNQFFLPRCLSLWFDDVDEQRVSGRQPHGCHVLECTMDKNTGDRPFDESMGDETKRKVESLLPGLVRRVIASGAEIVGDEKMKESLVADVVRKAFNKGNEVVDVTEDSVRRLLTEFTTARDISERLSTKLDEYKGEISKVLSQELNSFFDRVDLTSELRRILTEFSVEINAEVKFNPRVPQSASPQKKTGKRQTRKTSSTRRKRT